jgi:cell division protein FtsI (penicillin-binding protein 3)
MVRQVNRKTRDWSKFRLIMLAALFGLAWLCLWARAFQVQVVMGPDLSKQANRQYWTREVVAGERGEIYDRNGEILAKTVVVKSVFARPEQIENPGRVSRELSDILGLEPSDILDRLRQPKHFVWIKRQIADSKSQRIRAAGLAGVYLTEEQRRFYPQGHMAGQLLGFVGLDNSGLEGLELSFDSYLQGQKKEYVVQRDAAGHLLFAPGQLSDSLSGSDLQLTLDASLQYAAEKALARAVEKYNGSSGNCLVVEVDSGAILAWANYPFFNPNNYRQSSASRWRNRAALDEFEPGSTMKPILVAAALEEEVCRPQQIYYCENGGWRFQGHNFRDTHDYGWLPVHRIIRYSSNIGAAKIGLELGARTYFSYLRNLGLGRKTSLPLPGQGDGILRPPGAWTDIDLATASFGQGISMTSLQLARMYLCLANMGRLEPLSIIRQPESEKGQSRRVFSRATAKRVLAMLEDVVQEDGTGTKARIQGMKVGGKTGTAQKVDPKGGYGDTYLSSFVGLFPAEQPKYLVLAVIDEPTKNHYGGVVAAPAVRQVGLELMASHRNVQQASARREAQAASIPRSASTKRKTHVLTRVKSAEKVAASGQGVPDLRGLPLRRAMEILLAQGVVPQLKGRGVLVDKQKPAPGEGWPDGSASGVTLWLSEQAEQQS